MSNSFSTSRNIELSTIFYLETELKNDWGNINIVKSFTNAYKAALPVVAINLSSINSGRREIGATTLLNDYIIDINIFASSDGLRIDLVDYIMNKLKDCWDYYTHSQTSGSPETLTRVADGKIFTTDYIMNDKINLGVDADVYDRFRSFIQIAVRPSE
uniref:Tail protein n=1 Tax=viral metagenome TaxID=1070528 RepID=A0A6M3K5Z3_9ZZZZ